MRNLILAATVACALIGDPALAQDAAPSPTAAATAPTEAEIRAAGDAFGTEMDAMHAELQAAKTAAGSDTAKAASDADAIQVTYQAKADAFAATLQAFIAAAPGSLSAETVGMIMTQIQGAPAMVRQSVMTDQPAPAPAN